MVGNKQITIYCKLRYITDALEICPEYPLHLLSMKVNKDYRLKNILTVFLFMSTLVQMNSLFKCLSVDGS